MTTVNMLLDLPIVGVTLSPTWASDLNVALTLIDEHDHTSGKGVRIPSDGLDIDSDLSFNSNNAVDLRSASFDSQVSTLPPTDVNALYVSSGDLYYNNSLGNPIQITTGSSLDTGSLALNVYETSEILSNTTILSTDSFVFLDVDTSAARSITLPAASAVTAGRYYIIKDKTGDADVNNITIYPDGSDTIDGVASTLLVDQSYSNTTLVSDGTSAWLTVGKISGFLKLGGDLLGDGSTVNQPRVGTLTGISNLVKMDNETSLSSRNVGNSTNISLIKANASDEVEVGDASFDLKLTTSDLKLPDVISGADPVVSATTLELNGSASVEFNAPSLNVYSTNVVDIYSDSVVQTSSLTRVDASSAEINLTATNDLNLIADQVVTTGKVIVPSKSVSSSYTVDTTTNDEVIFVDSAGGGVTITMPSPTAGRRITVKDKNSASTNNITLDIGMSGQIEGVGGSYIIDKAMAGVTFVADGTDWWLVNRRGTGAPTSYTYVQQRIPIGLDPDNVAGTWSTSAGLQSISSLLTNGSARDIYILNPPNGATLESITMRYNPGGVARAPETRLGIYIERLSTSDAMTTGNGDSLISGVSVTSGIVAQVPAYASYVYQTYEFVCDQNNVIDSNQYTYVIRVVSESGAGATNTNSVSGFTFKYSVPDIDG